MAIDNRRPIDEQATPKLAERPLGSTKYRLTEVPHDGKALRKPVSARIAVTYMSLAYSAGSSSGTHRRRSSRLTQMGAGPVRTRSVSRAGDLGCVGCVGGWTHLLAPDGAGPTPVLAPTASRDAPVEWGVSRGRLALMCRGTLTRCAGAR